MAKTTIRLNPIIKKAALQKAKKDRVTLQNVINRALAKDLQIYQWNTSRKILADKILSFAKPMGKLKIPLTKENIYK